MELTPEDMALLNQKMMADPKVQATLKAIRTDIEALMERDFNPEQQSFSE